jgi:hypothetical protein
MAIERGILVDAKGNFLGAFQWDGAKPRPQFNLPRQGSNSVRDSDRKTLLAASVAEPGMEFKRWDFKNEVWISPDQTSWFVDENGNLRGSRQHFTDQIPNVPIGWTVTNKTPLQSQSQRPYFDITADEWKLPLRVAQIENRTLVNFICIREGEQPPPGIEYIPRPVFPDGGAVPIGTVREVDGSWLRPVVVP